MTGPAKFKTLLLAGTTLGAFALGATGAQAGGFAIHEQSAYFQGSSFAGAAAGGVSISSMYWNPSTMMQSRNPLTTESVYSGIIADTKITPITATAVTGANLLPLGPSGDIAQDAIVPASYAVYRWNEKLAFGISLNSPFGLVTSPNTFWAGQFYSRDSRVHSINATPAAAYQVNDWLAVGAGLQIQYFRVVLENAFPGAVGLDTSLRLQGESTDVGFTAGITLTPTPWTTIGLGYRSAITHTIQGTAERPPFVTVLPIIGPILIPGVKVATQESITLPDSASLGIRQKVTEQLTLLGTVEWTNWSRLKTVNVVTPPAPGVLGVPATLPFEWRDGWFFSVGAEYQWSPSLTLRAGIGFEQSPITDGTRTTRLPDNDRTWVSAGLTYNWSQAVSFDLGYSHIFVKDTNINLSAASGNPSFNPLLGTFIGTADSSVDIISVAFRYRWGVVPVVPLITKG